MSLKEKKTKKKENHVGHLPFAGSKSAPTGWGMRRRVILFSPPEPEGASVELSYFEQFVFILSDPITGYNFITRK